MSLRFSIAIPSFQQGRYLERAICSVLDQGVDTELFVLDGGSSDESLEVIRRHEDKIRFWRSAKDQGQTAAINEGLAMATGDIFAYLNSDDYLLPGVLRKVEGIFSEQRAPWLAGDAWYLREGSSLRHRLVAETPPRDPVLLWGHPWCPPQPSTFWKLKVLQQAGPFRADLKFNMDAEMAVRLIAAGIQPTITHELLSVRWDHAQAKSAERGRFFSEWLGVVKTSSLPESKKRSALQLTQNRIRWGRDVRSRGRWLQRLADVRVYPPCLLWYCRSRP